MNELEQIKAEYIAERNVATLEARESFWHFQKLTDPANFNDSRTYLIILSLALQSFYACRPVSYSPTEPIKELDLDGSDISISINNGTITVDCEDADILIIEIPPRHHKSHSLIHFEDWVFGQDNKQIIITASYNSVLANEFSQYVRDGIEQTRMKSTDIIYSDVFPFTRMKYGDRSKQRWSLEGTFLSYTGAGILSGVMGKGGNLIIIDDPIKGALEAFNEKHLEKVWTSYTNSWLSRLERPRKQILVMTPWIEDDPGDRIITGAKESGEIVKVLNMPVYSEKQGMLCDDILDKRSFDILSARLDPIILSGNYLCRRLGLAGKLYKNFNLYKPEDLPDKFDEIFVYIDTADEGSDYLFAGAAGIEDTKDEHGFYLKKAYLLDVYGSKDGMEITEPATAKFLADLADKTGQNINVMIESNNGGRGFARNVESILEIEYPVQFRKIVIEWFHQSENKQARINSESNTIMRFCYFPANWKDRWPKYYELMKRYSREGDNEYDDHADMTTGIAEHINTEMSIMDILNR